MTLDEFKHSAEAWGGQLERWPKDLRAPARLLTEQSSEARRILDEARLLDDRLGLAQDWPVAEHRAREVASRVLVRIAEADRAETASWAQTLGEWLLPAGGFAVAAGLGIALAIVMAHPSLSGRETPFITAILESGALAEDLVVE